MPPDVSASLPAAPAVFHPVTLTGRFVQLVPLAPPHHDGLVSAVCDGNVFDLWYTSVPSPEGMHAEIERRLALQTAGSMLPFTVIEPGSGDIVGMTTYMGIDAVHRRVEIGSTWYAARVRRSALNTEAKLLLLTHAFEHFGCIAVEFRTSFFNHASRRAIERLGAKQDGILRNHMVSADGTLRDTVVYSILNSEWPAVRAHLKWQMAKPR